MKNLAAALMTSFAIVSLGAPLSVSAQDMAGKPLRTAATSRRLTGEVLAVNRQAAALTVRSITDGKATDVLFSVPESMARGLDNLEPGDLVGVSYERVNDHFEAQRIVRAPEAPHMQ